MLLITYTWHKFIHWYQWIIISLLYIMWSKFRNLIPYSIWILIDYISLTPGNLRTFCFCISFPSRTGQTHSKAIQFANLYTMMELDTSIIIMDVSVTVTVKRSFNYSWGKIVWLWQWHSNRFSFWPNLNFSE